MPFLRARSAVFLMVSASMLACGAGVWARTDEGGPIGDLPTTSIALQSGTVDTSKGRTDLARFITNERQTTGLAGRHFVIQLAGPMQPEWRSRLQQAGIVELGYLPVHAFIVSLDQADPARVGALEFIQWFSEYLPAWKTAPNIGQRPFVSPERQTVARAGQVVVIISLFADATPDEVVRAIATWKDAQAHWISRIGDNSCIAATISVGDVARLASMRSVQFIEDAPDPAVRNDTDRWIVQSNVQNLTPLYAAGIHGEGQVLGHLDTRVDRNHCSFLDTQPIGPLHRKILAYNATAGAEFHGTHVACTAVGDHGDFTDTRGIAYLGKLVFNTIPAYTETEIMNRLNLHHTQGARVHTNSWGDDSTTAYNSLCRGIDSFSYSNEDDLVCFAVTNTSTLKNPENAKNLLAVGGSQDAPNQANFCTGGTGPTADQRRKPEIYAPGCSILSANAGSSCGITTATGTSMACPAVAASAMLTRQYFTDGYYPSGVAHPADARTPSGALLKAVLLNSAVDMTGIAGYPSNQEGWGRVLLDQALYFPSDTRKLTVVDVRNASGLTTNGVSEIPINVLGSGERLKVTLTWTEPPAAAGASFASVNDLDLEVVAPSGTVYKGNVFSGGESAAGGARDDRNNVEQVHFAAPSVGVYTVRVRGTAVNVGTQGYALAVSGDTTLPGGAVSITLQSPLPTSVAPGQSMTAQLTIDSGRDQIVPGSALVHWRTDQGAYHTASMTPGAGTTYTGVIPGFRCGDHPQIYFSVEGVTTGVVTAPNAGEAAPYAVALGVPATPFVDDFETSQGWTSGWAGDTATAGFWTRVTPNAGIANPSADHSDPGTMCFVTGQEPAFGGSAPNDVDTGMTSLVSPRWDLSRDSRVVVSYWRWFNNSVGSNPRSDSMTVQASSDDGATWVILETVGPNTAESSGGWYYHEAMLDSFISLTDRVRVRFVASDTGGDSIIEAGVDDVRVTSIRCVGVVCPCDWDGSGSISSQDLFDFVTGFFGGSADFNGDQATNSQDFFDFLACFFAGCG